MSDTIRQLTPKRWDDIQKVVDRVWAAPAEERQQVLEEACGEDISLREQVELMLDADEATSPLDESVADDALRVLADREREKQNMAGREVGHYRLVRKLGEGGMGMVYLGERADGAFEQYVAVKLLRSTVSDDIEQVRFRTEQQVLASLDHRSIAALYDAGQTNEGRAYFIMEYVEGRRITEYCRWQRIDVESRVRLVLDVARALQYAHGKLIIHRDVKPSNLLVDGQGRVKLLDFGIAKLLGDSSSRPAAVTRSDERPMTIEYAAPEQIRGRDITIRTDVYQLGVVLYELLTGRRPFRRGADLYVLAREICEVGASRPSLALRTDERQVVGGQEAHADDSAVPVLDSPLDGAAYRRERQLRERQLRGDLDAIVMRAVARETEDRYPSMEAFAADLQAYLGGKPVAARAPSMAYNSWKFLRRHPLASVAVALFAVLLTGWAVTATVQSERVREAYEVAQAESTKASQTAEFLENIFQSWDPTVGPGDRILVRDLLADTQTRLYEELAQTPQVRARLMVTLGRLYQALGLYQEQVELAADAVEIRQQLLVSPDPGLLEAYRLLAEGLQETGAFRESLLRFQEARSEALALGGEPLVIADIESGIANSLLKVGDIAAARERYEASLALFREAGGTSELKYAEALADYSNMLFRLDGWEEAVEANAQALAVYRERYGDRHQEVAIVLNQRGAMMRALGKAADAKNLHQEALAIQLERLDPSHEYLARTRSDLARALTDLEQYQAARDQYLEALSIRQRAFGETDTRTAATHFNLGDLLVQMGELTEAEAAYSAATEIDREVLGPTHPNVGMHLTRLASVVYLRGDLGQALTLYDEALAVLPEELLFRSSTLLGYGKVLRDLGQTEEARRYLEEALEIRQAVVPTGHPRLLEVEEAIASL
ncbi:MAG: serine/threonine-protein kinase [Pseudomonadota bacterium]